MPWPYTTSIPAPQLCFGGHGTEKPPHGYLSYGRGHTWSDVLGHMPDNGGWWTDVTTK